MAKNTFAARQKRAAEIGVGNVPAHAGAAVVKAAAQNETPQPAPPPGQVMQFNIDQLFAALGAKEFECTMLRTEVQRLQQQVATYRNIVEKSAAED